MVKPRLLATCLCTSGAWGGWGRVLFSHARPAGFRARPKCAVGTCKMGGTPAGVGALSVRVWGGHRSVALISHCQVTVGHCHSSKRHQRRPGTRRTEQLHPGMNAQGVHQRRRGGVRRVREGRGHVHVHGQSLSREASLLSRCLSGVLGVIRCARSGGCFSLPHPMTMSSASAPPAHSGLVAGTVVCETSSSLGELYFLKTAPSLLVGALAMRSMSAAAHCPTCSSE
jgi:hypothetical protein